ncbi:hypothetical protein [Parachryseolinea silvisoli]|uniref:hypothetical protein n=1 Tax=Parachryseolinea silvisoli TaxID=2873601 RepID=UPI002265B59A|nr:hypothetical protein [Parachryseolinea silvisoli]MCD9013897.1 hypothetical protein [Parachryseolinea silvisoli]
MNRPLPVWVVLAAMLLCACEWQARCLSETHYPALVWPVHGEEVEFTDEASANDQHPCLTSLFDKGPWKLPIAMDPAYAPMMPLQHDTLVHYSSPKHANTFIMRIDSTARYVLYILREELNDNEDGPDQYDILFTVDQHGKLIDNLMIGVDDEYHHRAYWIESPTEFGMKEVAGLGMEEETEYKATCRVTEAGAFALILSNLNRVNGHGENYTEEVPLEYAESIVTVETGKPVLAAIEKAIFVDPLDKDYLDEKTVGGQKIYLALGMSGVADYTLFMLHSPMGDGNTLVAESWTIPMPLSSREITSSHIVRMDWLHQEEDEYNIELTVQYEMEASQEGGAPPAALRSYTFTYSPEGGLEAARD